ncbi:unnamed protein product [Fusarium equiseti]|uniref:Heterokaryon incompatibility domain-containing protein n=1 Tax=Fusarium equiseti TaxID=61235 RepID=A0A8J2N9I1_FUSEQ|nr:unnamed protein product [Fusarium equiseti]
MARSGPFTLYTYSALNNPSEDIRLIELHPGVGNEDIKISIHQAPLRSSGRPRWQSVDLASLRKTIPPDWWVYQDINNRIYFYYENDQEQWKSQWSHPDENFDISPYEIPLTYNPVAFEALSYTWGDMNSQKHVALVVSRASDSSEAITELLIGPNLASALRHLRFMDRSRTLWVDAVCINQNDIPERDEQVKRMATIYREATRVLVWLGPSTAYSSLAMKTLSYIGSQVVITTDKWQFTAPGATQVDWCYNATQLQYPVETWEAVNELLQQPWFGRVWIVQEIHLAQEAVLCCGLDEILWGDFRQAIILLCSKEWLNPALSRRSLAFIEGLVLPVTTNSSIYHILHRTDGRGCQDRRDLIYGVLGLFPDRFQMKVQPQYFLPVEKIYEGFVRSHIQHVQRLELLRDCHLEGRDRGHIDAPSWVPSYSEDRLKPKPADWQFASGYAACQVVFKGDKELHAAGVYCGTVNVTKRIPNYRQTKDKASSMHVSTDAIRDVVSWMKTLAGTNRTLWDTFTRTLACNYLKDRFPDNRVDSLKDWESHIETSSLFTAGTSTDSGETTISFKDEHALGLLLGRSCFVMDNGDIGLGPYDAIEGDLVVCLLGCDSPILVRPVFNRPVFEVVGECFVRSLSDNQAFLGPLPSPWIIQFFSESPDGSGVYRYYNEHTLTLSDQDPRLGPLAEENLEIIESDRTMDDPITFRRFRDTKTGNTMHSDPRLNVDSLRERDINIRFFVFI